MMEGKVVDREVGSYGTKSKNKVMGSGERQERGDES